MPRERAKWFPHEAQVPMRSEGADGLVVARNPGNAGGAKGPESLADDMGQPQVGGAHG